MSTIAQPAQPAPSISEGSYMVDQNQVYDVRHQLPKLQPRRRRPSPTNATPFPQTPTLPNPRAQSSTASFEVPSRRILAQSDLELFLASPTAELVQAWIFTLADSVADMPMSAVKIEELSGPVTVICQILDQVEDLVAQSPPDEQGGSRFGNRRFRDFLDSTRAQSTKWHNALGIEDEAAIAELATYFKQSFGNWRRIDYGSGHELNFMMWLLCLYQLGILNASDFSAIGLHVFYRYLEVMRVIQITYYLEPAGSHGVWGLDDYQFLPFLFGASQLKHHRYITPRSIHQQLTLEENASEYLYLNQIVFVNSTKTVEGLRWHSPMLDDISSAKSWEKVEGGMRRMFLAEILRKLPVMQHFLFGSLIPAVDGMSMSDDQVDGEAEDDGEGDTVDVFAEGGVKHVHQQNGWGECCGIKVPSGVAAGIEARRKGTALRRIPFD